MEGDNLYTYGAPYGANPAYRQPIILDDRKKKRKNVNPVASVPHVLIPCGMFAGINALMSFFRYNHFEASNFLVVIGFAITAATYIQVHLSSFSRGHLPAAMYMLLSLGLFVAWLGGLIVGNINFFMNMKPYYDLTALNIAHNVDAATNSGAGYLDVGSIYFQEQTVVREDLSLGFKDGHTYCVAPIGSRLHPNVSSYAFWAVGINCCVPSPPAKFWCGSAGDYYGAYAGLRWMGDWDFFKLGIQQAGAEYGYTATNPVLLTWTKDPVADTTQMHYSGVQLFWVSIIVHFVIQSLFVLIIFLTPLGMLMGFDDTDLDMRYARHDLRGQAKA